MSGQFIGYFENAVHNQRVVIPASFKKKFSDAAMRTVILTAGPRNSIAVYPLDCWNATLEKLAAGDERQRKLRTHLIDCAVTEQELEGPGRIRIPELLLTDADITDSVVIKGEQTYITLWNPSEFKAKRQKDREENLREFDTDIYQVPLT